MINNLALMQKKKAVKVLNNVSTWIKQTKKKTLDILKQLFRLNDYFM